MSNNLKTQAMKRLLTIGLMLASALAFTNCSEQDVTPEKEQINVDGNIENNTSQEGQIGIPYEIYVNEPGTKTISDGSNTYWVDEDTALANGLDKEAIDRVTVYSSQSDVYTRHGKFVYMGEKRFLGELVSEVTGNNTWYCIYPYTAPIPESTGVVESLVFGASAAENFIQKQSSPGKAHIAGKNYPMWGTTTTNSSDDIPTFNNMQHLSALVAIKVKNESGNDITLEQIELIAQNNPIVGKFNVDVTGTTPSILVFNDNTGEENEENTAVSKTAILKLGEEGMTLAKGDEMTFYLATAPTNDTFTIRINGTAITNKTEIALTSGTVTTMSIKIPRITKTLSTNTSKSDGTEFITWDNNKTKVETATVNGEKGIQIRKVSDAIISISGKLVNFLGDSPSSSTLPLSFYAASISSISEASGQYVDQNATLGISEVRMDVNAYGYAFSINFDSAALAQKLGDGIPTSFTLPSIGDFGGTNDNNLVVLNEPVFYYYIGESKADYLISKVYSEKEVTIAVLRDAVIFNRQYAWERFQAFANVIAPTQMEGKMGSLVNALVSLGESVRLSSGALAEIQNTMIYIDLYTTGTAICWGLNVQSPDADFVK